MPSNLQLFDQSQPTICYTTQAKKESKENLSFVTLAAHHFIQALLSDLQSRKIQSLIVEGGSAILQAFIDLQLWDEARVFTAPQYFKQGIVAPKFAGRLYSENTILDDRLQVWLPH